MPAYLAEFVPNPGFVTELRCSPPMLAIVRGKVEAAKPYAESIAPVGNPADYSGDRQPGRYRRGMRVTSGIVNVPGIGRTAVGRLYNIDRKAHWVEYGNVRMPPRMVLHRAIEATADSRISVR